MGSLPQSSDSSSTYPPFKNLGNLEGLKEVQITPCLGSEYKDVDVTEWLKAPNSDDILRDLVITIAERGVVFFRNQNNMTNDLQKELCKRLNDLSGAPKENTFYRHSLLAMQGEDPEMGKVDQDRILKMYTPPKEGMPRQTHTKDWHSDSSFEPMPPSYTVLRMAELPATGGDTLWASGYELYDRLSQPWKRFAESLTATYKSTALANAAKENPKGMDSGPRGASGNVGLDFESHHPVVRTHPITGWKSWFAAGVNCFRIDDVTDMESEQILTKITRLITDNHDLQCRFRWEDPGDLAVWDNRCTLHAATQDHFGLGSRVGWRCMMMGEKPFLDPASTGRKEATGGWPYKTKAN